MSSPSLPAPHYFDREGGADPADIGLRMAIGQGYVPCGCLLSGIIVMSTVRKGEDPCRGCAGPRERCGGRHG